ncbi:MAG: 50S ribosome-binding GTPase [Anaerolineae bacterium]|nr:50S ribosome-binding GTPase [Anaerolineae bacterium]
MATIDDILDEFPGPVQQRLTRLWDELPRDMRAQLADVMQGVSPSLKVLKTLLPLVLVHYDPVLGNERRIAIVGPANVGKSTLYNQLIASEDDRAEVSAVPGTTRQSQEAATGLFVVVDTPGADAVGAVGQRERQIAFEAARRADFLVIVFEATPGIKQSERALFDDLLELDKPFIVVLNKVDLVPKRERDQVLAAAARNLGLLPSEVIPTVATEGDNVGRVILAVAKADPKLVKAIAEALPEYRTRLAWQRIAAAAGSAGAVGWLPLPIADLAPLLFIQTGLVLSIARIYGYEITAGRARELIATFGLGFAARAVYQQLSKLAGVPGWVLSAAIAAAATVAMGYSAMMWFGYGEKPTRESLQKTTATIAAHLRDRLLGLGQKRPDRGTLRQRITLALKDLPAQFPPRRDRTAAGAEDRSPEGSP